LLDSLIKLSNTLPQQRSTFGRPVEFPLPVLFVLLGLKFDSGLSYREFVAFVNFNPVLLEKLNLTRAPSYSLLQKSLKKLDTRLLHRMYQLLARRRPPPKTVAVDASGFSHTTGGEWSSVRFKTTRRRRFHGLHNAVDTDSLMITASRVRARPGGDAQHLVALVRRINPANLEVIYGDKGYISRKNVQFISDVGAYPAIEPKENAVPRSRGSPAYRQLVHEYQEGAEKWKENHQYGRRSLVETVFSMLKRRFGESLSSRGYRERRRELLFKVVLHNIERLNFLECDRR
jgi:transposase